MLGCSRNARKSVEVSDKSTEYMDFCKNNHAIGFTARQNGIIGLTIIHIIQHTICRDPWRNLNFNMNL